jgi:hypothetical protein
MPADVVLCVRINQEYVVSSSEDDSVRVWLAATCVLWPVPLCIALCLCLPLCLACLRGSACTTALTACRGRCVRVMDMRQALVDMALHASSILLTAIGGEKERERKSKRERERETQIVLPKLTRLQVRSWHGILLLAVSVFAPSR